MRYDVRDDGQSIQEDVDLYYKDNYIWIEAPAIDGKTPVTLIHDFTAMKLYLYNFVSML